jgi:hypothetical protein
LARKSSKADDFVFWARSGKFCLSLNYLCPIPRLLGEFFLFTLENVPSGSYISALENKRKTESDKKRRKGGWVSQNPEEYKILADGLNFIALMIGSVIGGLYLSKYFEQPWIFWVAIGWGVFFNLFKLAWKFTRMDKKSSAGKDDEKAGEHDKHADRD